jgi:hypothetical protein
MLGDGLAALAIPLLVLDLTRNPLLSALSAASVTVGYLLVGLPAGVLVDRLDPWRVLIAMDAARTLLFAALYALSVAGVLRVWLVLTLALSAGEMRLVVLAIGSAGVAVAAMWLASSAAALALANLGYGAALVVASLVNRTQRQRLVPRHLLGRVTSTVRVLFLAMDPLGVVAAGAATVALGGDPRPVFLAAGTVVVLAAALGWATGLRAAAGCADPRRPGPGPAGHSQSARASPRRADPGTTDPGDGGREG